MLYYDNNWFSERSKLYAQMSDKDIVNCKNDSTFFQFSQPKGGVIGMDIFVNGALTFHEPIKRLSNLSQFDQIRDWLELIVKEDNIECCARIEREDHEDMYFHYEALYKSYVGITCTNGTSVKHDTNTNPSIGLFYIYDAKSKSIPCSAICYTKEFVRSIYYAVLDICKGSRKKSDPFIKEWFIFENYDHFEWALDFDMWDFYNDFKSLLVEWYLDSLQLYCKNTLHFKPKPEITERIHMWAEYGDALFWTTGGCCGSADEIYTDRHGVIDLRGIKGLKEWYDDWDGNPSYSWPKEKCKAHRERGLELAKQIRAILPDSLDLYYDFWEPSAAIIDNPIDNQGYKYKNELPMIVFNQKLLDNSQND